MFGTRRRKPSNELLTYCLVASGILHLAILLMLAPVSVLTLEEPEEPNPTVSVLIEEVEILSSTG